MLCLGCLFVWLVHHNWWHKCCCLCSVDCDECACCWYLRSVRCCWTCNTFACSSLGCSRWLRWACVCLCWNCFSVNFRFHLGSLIPLSCKVQFVQESSAIEHDVFPVLLTQILGQSDYTICLYRFRIIWHMLEVWIIQVLHGWGSLWQWCLTIFPTLQVYFGLHICSGLQSNLP